MKVRILALGDVPPRLSEAVLAGLPRPFAGGEVAKLSLVMDSCYDRQRAQVDAACLINQVPDPEQLQHRIEKASPGSWGRGPGSC